MSANHNVAKKARSIEDNTSAQQQQEEEIDQQEKYHKNPQKVAKQEEEEGASQMASLDSQVTTQDLDRLYFSARPYSLSNSVADFRRLVKQRFPHITKSRIDSYLRSNAHYVMFLRRPSGKRNRYSDVTFSGDLLGCDIFFPRGNRGDKFLVCMDYVSRKMWQYFLPDRSIKSLHAALRKWLLEIKKKITPFTKILSDRERALVSPETSQLFREHGVLRHQYTFSRHHVSFVEHSFVSLRRSLARLSAYAAQEIDLRSAMRDLIAKHNDEVSNVTGFTPNSLWRSPELALAVSFIERPHEALGMAQKKQETSLRASDWVRVATRKRTFAKGSDVYAPAYSRAIYEIVFIDRSRPIPRVKLKKLGSRVALMQNYYVWEVFKLSKRDLLFAIEKVRPLNKKQVLVKFQDYDNYYPIDKSEITETKFKTQL